MASRPRTGIEKEKEIGSLAEKGCVCAIIFTLNFKWRALTLGDRAKSSKQEQLGLNYKM